MAEEKVALVQYRQTLAPITSPLFMGEMALGIKEYTETQGLPPYALLLSGVREKFDMGDTTVVPRTTDFFQRALTESGLDVFVRHIILCMGHKEGYGGRDVSSAMMAIHAYASAVDPQSVVRPEFYKRRLTPGTLRAPLSVITDLHGIVAYALTPAPDKR
ncbi:MAG: hypothetical protein Q7S65_00215 [Nanoarchaeota archaeon]|nr:hypothetical protein [Nanoarchaeota archaeon]